MVFEIVIHSFCQEIDDLQQTLTALKRSSKYLDDRHSYKVTVLLNTNLIDWGNSKLTKDYFKAKFKTLEELTASWACINFKVEEESIILGNFSFHRTIYQKTNSDFILNIDTDIIFSETLLANIVNAAESLQQTYPCFVLTPEVSKLWDNSWDVIVSSKYRNLEPSQDYTIADPYENIHSLDEVYIEETSTFKFGMGWFTLFSKDLLKLIELPESMGHYGPDDTFIMTCAQLSKNKGREIRQFVLRNEIIRENIKLRPRHYKDFLVNIDRKDKFRAVAESNFKIEVEKFISKINTK
jgi:hemerythrin superfamily protein